LVRRICGACKAERHLSATEQEYLAGLAAPAPSSDAVWYAGKGCEACGGSGYAGRVGIHEVLEIDQEIRDVILTKASASTLRSVALNKGMVPMLMDGLQKAALGLTTVEEVLRMRYA